MPAFADLIALGGMYLWRGLAAEAVEPWLQLVSGLIVIAMAFWMLWRTGREQAPHDHHDHHYHGDNDHHHHHHHDHSHDHHHALADPLALVGVEAHDAHERAHAEGIWPSRAGRPSARSYSWAAALEPR